MASTDIFLVLLKNNTFYIFLVVRVYEITQSTSNGTSDVYINEYLRRAWISAWLIESSQSVSQFRLVVITPQTIT